MFDLNKHFLITGQFLKDFENLQEEALHLRLEKSIPAMGDRVSEYFEHIRPVKEMLADVSNGHAYFLIKKRIDLLMMHIEMISPLINGINVNEKDPLKIIALFDKQHIFKKVILSHLKDLEFQLNS